MFWDRAMDLTFIVLQISWRVTVSGMDVKTDPSTHALRGKVLCVPALLWGLKRLVCSLIVCSPPCVHFLAVDKTTGTQNHSSYLFHAPQCRSRKRRATPPHINHWIKIALCIAVHIPVITQAAFSFSSALTQTSLGQCLSF